MYELSQRHRGLLLVLSAALPLVVCLLIVPFRSSVENTNAALVLVLVVVAAAATGTRPAGIIAALSSAASFDFFLTAPYNRLIISDRADIETTVLLVLLGVAVSEIALWGRRQQGQASRQQGYLAGVLGTVGTVAGGEKSPAQLAADVAEQLREVLAIDASRFEEHTTPPSLARLNADGTVSRADRQLDVERFGLPTDTEVELLVEAGGVIWGRYLLTSATRIRRPSLEQRQVAVALADQVGSSLAMQRQPGPDQVVP